MLNSAQNIISKLKSIHFISFIVLISVFVFSSCVSKGKLQYLKKEDALNYKDAYYNVPPVKTIKSHDNIYIKVMSIDADTRDLFKMDGMSIGGNMNLVYYEVSDSGYIDFPFVGKIEVGGLTLEQAKTKIEEKLSNYISDFAITVKMTNIRVSVLGEVQNPGTFEYYKEPLNILQAIGLAGGFGQFGNKEKVMLIREENNQITRHSIDLTKLDVVGSEYFYLKPDDTIIVEALKAKYYSLNPVNYGTFLSTVTTLLAVLYFFK